MSVFFLDEPVRLDGAALAWPPCPVAEQRQAGRRQQPGAGSLLALELSLWAAALFRLVCPRNRAEGHTSGPGRRTASHTRPLASTL